MVAGSTGKVLDPEVQQSFSPSPSFGDRTKGGEEHRDDWASKNPAAKGFIDSAI